jgi:hypothetical protein
MGATRTGIPDPTPGPDVGSSQAFLRAVCEQFDHRPAARHVHRRLHGVRPVSLDGFPLVGRCGVDGLVFATGTHRDGLHCSPAVAAHPARELLDGLISDERFAWYTYGPSIRARGLDQALEEATAHLVDGVTEYGLALPFRLDLDTVHDWERQRVERVYEHLEVALPPEIVVVRALIDPRREELLRRYTRAAARHHANGEPASRAAGHAGDHLP